MPKASITEREIGLIKAMRARGMKNKDIQFHFNRPERAVNSGRITGIANGSYSTASQVVAATDEELERFLADKVHPMEIGEQLSPLDEKHLRGLFKKKNGLWRLSSGETDTAECKTNFGMKHAHQWLKAIAGLANNRGGYVFFGVADGSHKGNDGEDLGHSVVGLASDDFLKLDPADITSRLKSYLDPTPRIQRASFALDGKKIGVIHVEQHPSRPVIATKADGDKIREGDIFYRYPGQTARIKYSDLRSLLDARDSQARLAILPLVEKLLSLGPQRALLADLEKGELHDGNKTIVIDPALVDQINFIREGSFDEVAGAPTLKLVGEVVSTGTSAMNSRGAITDDILLGNFLKQEEVREPAEYIRYAIGAGHATWLPLRYFARKAKLDRVATVSLIQAANGKKARKVALIEKLNNDNAAFKLYAGGPKSILSQIEAGEAPKPCDWKTASHIAQAICGLKKLPISGLSMLDLLEECRMLLGSENASLTYLRKAACRLDELMFSFPKAVKAQGAL